MRQRLRAFFSRGMDATIAVALVLAFFLVFMVILWISFPKGVGLGNAIRSLSPDEPPAHEEPVAHRPESRWTTTIARVTSVTRSVKSKQSDSIEWANADPGLELAERDAIQTFSESNATIVFTKSQQLTLGENALVVIRRVEKDAATDAQRASVVLLGGALEGSVGPDGGGGSSVEILAGKSATSIASRSSTTTKFRVAAAPNDASALVVLAGRADVTVGGRTIAVGPGQTVGISPQGVIHGPQAIAKAPVLEAPGNGAVLRSRVIPTEVAFAWKGDGTVEGARIELSRDSSFRHPLFDRRVGGNTARYPNLPEGRYFWRVRASDGLTEGHVAAASSFEVRKDVSPPPLEVAFPQGSLLRGSVLIRGTTEKGASVYVGRLPVSVGPEGAFEATVTLRAGVQVVVVEAVDAAGNIAYASRTLVAR